MSAATTKVLAIATAVTLAAGAAGCGNASRASTVASDAPAASPIEMPPIKAFADVHDLMHGIVDPAARRVWGAVGTVIDKKGTHETSPRNDEEWDEVKESALAIAEGGNLLLLEGRVKREREWIESVGQLIASSLKAVEAAKAKDKDALFAAGEPIYDACARCHATYLTSPEQKSEQKPEQKKQAP